jgi:branched-chain amino acid transport system substrate-binding protein
MKKLLLLAGICFLALACTKKESNVIRIGAAGQLTGPEAVFGSDMLNGVKLAVEEWNAKGGVLGKKIELVPGDDQAEPRQAVAVANKFVNEGVVGVVGHFNSSCSIPASEVYNKAGIPQISHASTNPKLTEQGFVDVFRVCGRDDQQGKAAADFAVQKLKVRRVAIIHDKTTYGQGFAEEFKKALGPAVEIVAYEGMTKGEKDYSPVVTKVKGANPDLVFFGGIYTEGGLLIRQFKAVGGTAPFIGGDGIMSEELVKIGGPAVDGTPGNPPRPAGSTRPTGRSTGSRGSTPSMPTMRPISSSRPSRRREPPTAKRSPPRSAPTTSPAHWGISSSTPRGM